MIGKRVGKEWEKEGGEGDRPFIRLHGKNE